jgi:protein-tyrosine phosphatase
MAEALLKKELLHKGTLISSAGLSALVGQSADELSYELMLENGIDISEHRARQLDKNMIREADIILVMELSHKNAIEDNVPSAKGKVFRLGEWGNFEIPDPYKKGRSNFVTSLGLIEQGVSDWAAKL